MHTFRAISVGAAVAALTLTACTTDRPSPSSNAAAAAQKEDSTQGTSDTGSKWFDPAEYKRQLAQRTMEPVGPDGKPWLQAIDPDWVDTTKYAQDQNGNTLCFSNASVSNPWRVTGYITMQQQVKVYQQSGDIGEFRVSDAADDDNKQISDIQAFVQSGDCNAIIISPSTTATLTPAVKAACQSGVPVIVFDRGVNTDCMATFIHPIGGYAYGADGAEFLVEHLDPGAQVLALRILPGVDVLEHRWAAAKKIFADSDLEVVGAEFTEGDAARIKDTVIQYLQRGEIDGIWMDAGDGAVAAVEAFEELGRDYPVMVGEDQMDFLRKWKATGMNAIAPVYSNFQWRTPIEAAVKIWKGEKIPSKWVLPQEPITEEDRDEFLRRNAKMPDLHYAKFGGENLPGHPQAWQDH